MTDNQTNSGKTLDAMARDMFNTGKTWLTTSHRKLLVLNNRSAEPLVRVNLALALIGTVLVSLAGFFWLVLVALIGGYFMGLRLDVIGEAADNGDIIEVSGE